MIHSYQNKWLFVRLTAMLLIVAVTVGTIMPLVWCFGEANHTAIEFKIAGTTSKSLNSQVDSHPVQLAAIAKADKFHPQDCIDRDAFPPFAFTNESDEQILAWNGPPTPQDDLAQLRAIRAAEVHQPFARSDLSTNEFPTLKHLKTVVLLI